MDKNIGIMTMHRIKNYGSFMQAFALKKIIESFGNNVSFVDYQYEGALINNKKNSFTKRIIRNLNIVKLIDKKINIRNFSIMYSKSLKKYLDVSNKKIYFPNIDELVIGSDEVFNCMQGFPVGYSRQLFGKGYENMPVITYAASFGQTTIEQINEYNITDELGCLFKNMSAISVRDNNSYRIIKDLIDISSSINIDPVLVYDFASFNVDKVKINNYILIYTYTGRISKADQKYIKNFARKIGKKIISLGGYLEIADYNLVVEINEVLSYFKHADFVIADTFHGVIFSIIMKCKFASLIREGNLGNINKLKDLLERLEQTDRIIYSIEDIEKLYECEVDYNSTEEILKVERKKAMEYIEKNLIK